MTEEDILLIHEDNPYSNKDLIGIINNNVLQHQKILSLEAEIKSLKDTLNNMFSIDNTYSPVTRKLKKYITTKYLHENEGTSINDSTMEESINDEGQNTKEFPKLPENQIREPSRKPQNNNVSHSNQSDSSNVNNKISQQIPPIVIHEANNKEIRNLLIDNEINNFIIKNINSKISHLIVKEMNCYTK